MRAEAPQLILLDLGLPDMCGYLLCKMLRDEFGDAMSIVFLSGVRTDRLDRTAGLLIGADDYMAKPVVLDEFLARVRRLTARAPTAAKTPPPRQLTRRELQVLRLFADHRPPPEIGTTLGISPGLVETHVQRAVTKLGAQSPAEAIAVATRARLLTLGTQTAVAASVLDAVGAI